MSLHDFEGIQARLKPIGDPVGFLTNLFAHAPVGFGVWTADGKVLLTNKAFFDIFQSEPPPEYNVLKDDILAKNGMLSLFERAFAGETVHLPTFWFDPRELTSVKVTDGRRVAVSMTIFPLFGASGAVEYVAATYKDETAVTLANERLARSEERQRLAERAGHVGTFHWTAEGGLDASPEFEALYGFAPGEFDGTIEMLSERIHPEDRAFAVQTLTQAFTDFLPVEVEWRALSKDGGRWIVSRFRVTPDAHGKPLRAVGLNIDITERKIGEQAQRAAEAAVKASEESLRITLQSIGDGVIATDATGCVTRMNPVAEQLTGWTLSEARGRKLTEVFDIKDETTSAPLESPVDRVLREGKVVGLANHTILRARDGTERAIADSGAPIRDETGGLRGVVLVFHDQSEQRRAARDLARSEARFQRLVGAPLLGIIITNLAGRILEANDAFLAMVGYTREEVATGKVRWTDLTPPEWRATDARVVEALKSGGAAAPWEKEYFHKDGHRIPILIGAALLEHDEAESIAFVLDLTERKRAEAALRESEAQKAAVMEAALDAIVLMDHEGKVTEFNAAAERTFGYTRAEVIGKPLAEIMIPAQLRDDHREGLRRYLATGQERILGRRIEVPALRRSNECFPAEVAIVRIRSAGAPVFTGYIRDITERRQAAQAEILKREKEAAEIANRELEAFSYSVAHDLRAPLRGINGFASALVEDYGEKLDEDGKGLLARITASANRMAELIDALLRLARLSRAELQRDAVDLAQLGRMVIEQLRAADPSREVEFVAAPSLEALGDPKLLRAALENLLGNAWKFTRNQPRSRIELGSAKLPHGTAYFVRDNGAGFDMKYADRLFTPFQRLHPVDQFEGSGIGLATVQRIIHRHGGRVWAEGQNGAGATFHFTLAPNSSIGEAPPWIPAP